MAVSVVVMTAMGIVEPKDFVVLATGAFSYYYGNNKRQNSNG